MTQGATHTVSYSELDAIRQCRLKAHLAYRERWQPEEVSAALVRGKLFHSVMEAHYKRALQSLALPSPWDIINSAGDSDEVDTVRWMYEGYLDCYGDDPEWEILAVEQRVEEWLPNPGRGRSAFKLKGFADLLIKDHTAGGGLFIVDHKTCRELPKQKQLDFDDQFGIYTWLLRKQGLNVRGVIYNACRTNKLKREMGLNERFKRELTVRSDRELETMAAEALATFKSAYVKPAPGTLPPRSPDPDRCGWRCPFGEPCLMSRKGKDIHKLLPEFGFAQNLERH
jgi:hypothetical protein